MTKTEVQQPISDWLDAQLETMDSLRQRVMRDEVYHETVATPIIEMYQLLLAIREATDALESLDDSALRIVYAELALAKESSDQFAEKWRIF